MFKFLVNWLLCQDRSVCESIHDSYRQLNTKWLSEYQHHVWKWNYSWWITIIIQNNKWHEERRHFSKSIDTIAKKLWLEKRNKQFIFAQQNFNLLISRYRLLLYCIGLHWTSISQITKFSLILIKEHTLVWLCLQVTNYHWGK